MLNILNACLAFGELDKKSNKHIKLERHNGRFILETTLTSSANTVN